MSLSATGNLLLGLTRRSKLYMDKTQLNIFSEKPVKERLETLVSGDFPWKTVKVAISGWTADELNIVKRLLNSESVQNLELWVPEALSRIPITSNFFEELILSTPKIKSLSFHSRAFPDSVDFLIPGLQERLSSLTTLTIVGTWSTHAQKPLEYLDHLFGIHSVNFNTLSISTISAMQLRKIHFSVGSSVKPSSSQKLSVKGLIQIVRQNKDTVQELTLHGDIWRSDEMKGIECHSLVSLDVTTNAYNVKKLAQFISNQPLLQTLVLNIAAGLITTMTLPNAVHNRSGKLKRLHIYWRLEVMTGIRFNWSFILEMPHLEDLAILQPEPKYFFAMQQISLSQILNLLPTSLKKLRIEGAPQQPLMSIAHHQHVSVFDRLTRLTSLDLMYTKNSITDTVLQSICSNMAQLIELRIYSCKKVTDFGLTGKSKNGYDTGISLSNLKRLRKLSILLCKEVTFEAMYSVIAFLELQELCITGASPHLAYLFVGIGIQNPSLEVFRIGYDFHNDFDINQLKLNLKRAVPRLTTLEVTYLERFLVRSSRSGVMMMDDELDN